MKAMRASFRLFMIVLLFLLMGLHLLAISFWLAKARVHRRRSLCVQAYLKKILAFTGLKIHLRMPLPKEENCLILANHVSYLDIIAIGSLLPISFLAKQEIQSWPLLSILARLANSIFVDRNCGQGRMRALRRLRQGVTQGAYCVFPEGTTTAVSAPLGDRWFRGNVDVARDPAVPIYAMGLHYSDQKQIAWVDEDQLIPHLWKLLNRDDCQLVISLAKLKRQKSSALAKDALWQIQKLCSHSAESAFIPDCSEFFLPGLGEWLQASTSNGR